MQTISRSGALHYMYYVINVCVYFVQVQTEVCSVVGFHLKIGNTNTHVQYTVTGIHTAKQTTW